MRPQQSSLLSFGRGFSEPGANRGTPDKREAQVQQASEAILLGGNCRGDFGMRMVILGVSFQSSRKEFYVL